MTWNYRLIKSKVGFSVHEVYYDDEGKPELVTTEPMLNFYCDTPEGVLEELEILKRAWEDPPLDMEIFVERDRRDSV